MDLSGRLTPALKESVARFEQRVQRAALRIEPPMRGALQREESRIEALNQKLGLLNPYGILGRGYSITLTEDGRVVRSSRDVEAGVHLTTRLGDGMIESVVVKEDCGA